MKGLGCEKVQVGIVSGVVLNAMHAKQFGFYAKVKGSLLYHQSYAVGIYL